MPTRKRKRDDYEDELRGKRYRYDDEDEEDEDDEDGQLPAAPLLSGRRKRQHASFDDDDEDEEEYTGIPFKSSGVSY